MLVTKQLWLPLTSIVWTINTETVIKIPFLFYFFSQGKSYRFGTTSWVYNDDRLFISTKLH